MAKLCVTRRVNHLAMLYNDMCNNLHHVVRMALKTRDITGNSRFLKFLLYADLNLPFCPNMSIMQKLQRHLHNGTVLYGILYHIIYSKR